MKFFLIATLTLIMSCSHQQSSRNIASAGVGPLMRAALKAMAKHSSKSADDIGKELFLMIRKNPEEFGFSAKQVLDAKTLDDLPIDQFSRQAWEEQALFKFSVRNNIGLNSQSFKAIKKELSENGFVLSEVEAQVVLSELAKKSSKSRLLSLKDKTYKIISYIPNSKIRTGLKQSYDNLLKNFPSKSEKEIVSQAVSEAAEISRVTGLSALAPNGCNSIGGKSIARNLKEILSAARVDSVKDKIKTYNELFQSYTKRLAERTKRTFKEACYAVKQLAVRRAPASVNGCSVFPLQFVGIANRICPQ